MEHLQDVIRTIDHDWPTKQLLVVGDVMLDKYIWGDVERISPEAPVPVVQVKHETRQPGGAANVAMNLVHMGAKTRVIGFAGGDEDEQLLSQSLQASGIEPLFVTSAGFPTTSKLRIVGGKQQMLRIDCEHPGTRPKADQDRLIELALSELPNCDGVVLSDYSKGVLTPEVCQALISRARNLGIPVLVDPKGTDFSRYRGASTICPNMTELARAANLERRDLSSLLDAAECMVSQFDVEFLTVTLSERGIALVRPSNRFLAPATAREVFDVSGAGDTVIAVLALSISSGIKPEIGVQLANLAAGVVIAKVGTVPIEKHELLAALSPDTVQNAEEKVLSLSDLLSRVAAWRKNGNRIVFTNGCFDLLHVGHITLIEQARRFGDRLVIGMNSDASVTRLKGTGRPVVGECERARVLAALSAVDAVVIFEEATPLELIHATRPDVIVKGGDYTPDLIVGAREVESWGGQVRIVPTVVGFSTTNLMQKHGQR